MKIAFMGISGSGKDYFVNYLVDRYSFQRFSFSDQLKQIATKIFPWISRDYPAFDKEKKLNIKLSTNEMIQDSPRTIWLKLNCLRDIESKIFIRMLEDEIHKVARDVTDTIQDDCTSIVISDVRTIDEYHWCKKNQFKIIYINPIKNIYPNNTFDKNVSNSKMIPNYTFNNNFNGIEEFKEFFINKVKTNEN